MADRRTIGWKHCLSDCFYSAMESLVSVSTEAHCFDVQFHPSESLLAASTITGEVELHRFDASVGTAELLRKIVSHKESCRTSRFLPQATVSTSSSSTSPAPLLASASADRFAALADVETGERVWRCKLRAAGCVLLPLSGAERFAIGDDDGGLRVFDGRQKKAAVSWAENSDFISDLAIGADGTSLCATSGDGTLAVYDVRKSGEKGLIAMSDFQEDELLSVAITRDGKKVVCGTQTGTLPIFTWGDFGDQKDRIKGHPMSVDAMVKFAEDGVITGSSDGKIRVVAVHSQSLGNAILGVIGEHGSSEYPIERLSLSPDGKYLASASHEQPAVRLWSTEAARRLLAGESVAAVLGQEGASAEGAAEADSSDEDSEMPAKKRRKLKDKKKGKKGGGVVNQAQQKASSFFSGL
eukprot:TRINITY_DN76758_c0_g1_i1.p1 TRINITY_DN76758_c0_g1~~TRINITY_DN76758_c0_g1_i1.p1  ORF type:complete len:411 (+),score=102.89 TRINITY_DN76758_c0_g1_i1:33-1265(+)